MNNRITYKGIVGRIKQRGISLLEVMLSISVIALILVMATRFFYVTSSNNKVNTAISQVAGLEAAMYSWKGSDLNYTGVSIQALYDAGELANFPGVSSETEGAVLYTPWGTSQYVVQAKTEGGAQITAADVPNCAALAKALGDRASCDENAFTYDVE